MKKRKETQEDRDIREFFRMVQAAFDAENAKLETK
jgi:hypothetical protein